MFEIALAGERAVLLPEHALWLPAFDALLVADLHWGKAAAFRAANVPVPSGTTAADLARLTRVLAATRATRLIVLGDLIHARHGRHADTMATIAAWRAEHTQLAIDLVRGNHDAHAGDPPDDLEIRCVDALALGPFACVHEPDERDDGYVLAGHVHPHVSLSARGKQHVRLACFAFGPLRGVLPAFSSFTGGGMYERLHNDAVYAIAGDEVLAIP